MMRLARSSFPRSCASERPEGARINTGGRKQAQGEGTQPGVYVASEEAHEQTNVVGVEFRRQTVDAAFAVQQ